MRRPWLLSMPFVLLMALAVACGDGGSSGGPEPTMVPPVETVPVISDETPTSFEALKGELAGRLEGFGVNIGSVPDDVRRQLLGRCGELEAFAESGAVEDICSSIDDAFEQGTPATARGLIDAIVVSLSELQAE